MDMNLPSLVILILVLLCLALAVRYLIRHRGSNCSGCSGCSGNCASCRRHCQNKK